MDLYDPSAPTATSDIDLVSALVTTEDSGVCAITTVNTLMQPSYMPDAVVVAATTCASASDPVATSHCTSLELDSANAAHCMPECHESRHGVVDEPNPNGDFLPDDSNSDSTVLPQEPLEQSVLVVSMESATSNAMHAMDVGLTVATSDQSPPSHGDSTVVLEVQKDGAHAQHLQQDASPATPHNGQLKVQTASMDEEQKSSPTSKKESSRVQSNSRSHHGSRSPVDDREECEKSSRHHDEPERKSRDKYIGHRKPPVREERRNSDQEHRWHAGHEERKPSDYEDRKRTDREDRRPSDFEERKRTDFQERRRADYGDRRHTDYEDRKRPDHDNRRHIDYEERRRTGHDDKRSAERTGQKHRDFLDRRQSTQDNHRRSGHDDQRSPRRNTERQFDRDSYRFQGRSDGRCRVDTLDGEDKPISSSKSAVDKSSKTVHRERSRSRSLSPGRQPRANLQRRVSDHHNESPPVRRPANYDTHLRPSPAADSVVQQKSSSRRSRGSPGAKPTSRQVSVDTAVTASPQVGGTKPQSIPRDQADTGSDQSSETDLLLDAEARSPTRRDTRRSSPQATQMVQLPSQSVAADADQGDNTAISGPVISIGELRASGVRPQPSASPAQLGLQANRSAESSKSYAASDTVSSLSFTELMRLPPPPLPPPTLIMPLAPCGPTMMAGMPPTCVPPPPSVLPQSLSLQYAPAHHGLLAHHGMPPPPLGVLPPPSLGLLPPPLGVLPPPHGVRPPHCLPPFIPTSSSGQPLFLSPPPLGPQSYVPPPAGHSPFLSLPFAPPPSGPPPFVSPPSGPPPSEPPPPPPPASSPKVHGIDRLVGVHGDILGPHYQRHQGLSFVSSVSPPPPPDFFTGTENNDEALKARSNLIVIQPSDAGSHAHQEPCRKDTRDKCSSSDDMTEAPMDMTADDDDDDEQDDDIDLGTAGDGNAAKDIFNGKELLLGSMPSEGVSSLAATAGWAAAALDESRSGIVQVGQGDVAAAVPGSGDAAQPQQRTIEVLQQLQQLLSRGGTSQQGQEPQAKSEMHTGVLGAVLSGKSSSNDVVGEALPKKTKKAGAGSRAQSLKVKESPGSDIPSSATELSNLKAIEKMNRQERIAEEVKVVLKPYYRSGKISKTEYKEIMKKAVHKIYNSKSGAINPMKVKIFIDGYVAKTIQVHKLHRKRQQVQS